MSQEVEAFLREGLFRYAEAASTIHAFTSLLEKRLLEVLRCRSVWGKFTPLPRQIGKQVFTSNAANDRYVYAWLDGEVEGRTIRLMIGVFWPGDVRFYAECWEPTSRKWLDWGAADRLEGVSVSGRKFTLNPGGSPDFDADFNRLIDQVVASLSRAS